MTSAGGGGSPSAGRRVRWMLALAGLLMAAGSLNVVLVSAPVHAALASNERNSGYTLVAYWRFGVWPGTVVLDLWGVEHASGADLMRGVLTSARALADAGRSPTTVILARQGRSVFVLDGAEFVRMGQEYGLGQNPVYLFRTFPEKVSRLDGHQAYGTWTGGWLGVLSQQMQDVNVFVGDWIRGDPNLVGRNTALRY